MYLHNCRCFQEHLTILLQGLGAHCKAEGGPGSIWNNLKALVRSPRVSGSIVCGFSTDSHFADELAKVHTFWRYSRAAKTCVLHRRNLTLETSRWQPWDTFRIRKRSSKHPGHSFNMMVWLHWNCQKEHLCNQLCLQRTFLDDELDYSMSAESENFSIIQLNVKTITHLKPFQTLKIGYTGKETWIIHITVKSIVPQTLNVI